MLFLLALACAPETTPCDRFIAAKKSCYEAAEMTDDTPDVYCTPADGDTETSGTADDRYTCYAKAYESAECTDTDAVGAAGNAAAECDA